MTNILKNIIKNRNGRVKGVYSACTANELVIEAVMERAKETNIPVLIEATANQVNQFGGYTSMTPKDYTKFVSEIANRVNLPHELLILGGDHLGPLTWVNLSEETAMSNSDELICQYVAAGFTKIHIDTSMRLEVLDDVMLQNTSNWKKHYHGDNLALKLKRKYSFSDRCRYYLPEKEVSNALNLMINNLDNAQIPLSLLSQYMPVQKG